MLWWFKHIPTGLFGFANNSYRILAAKDTHTSFNKVNTWEKEEWGRGGAHGGPSAESPFFRKEISYHRHLNNMRKTIIIR